jgi:hypothetical protein
VKLQSQWVVTPGKQTKNYYNYNNNSVIKKNGEKSLKYKYHIKEIQRMWNVKKKSDTSYNRGNLNRFKIIQTIPKQHTWKARN